MEHSGQVLFFAILEKQVAVDGMKKTKTLSS